MGEHVVRPGPHKTQRDSPDDDVKHDAGFRATRLEATVDPDRSDDDPNKDDERVGRDAEVEGQVPTKSGLEPRRDVDGLPLIGRARDAERQE